VAFGQDLLEQLPIDVLHDDVPVPGERHRAVDLDDRRVLDLRQELPLGDRRSHSPELAHSDQLWGVAAL
jgi:hypothetical protein